MLGLQTDEFYLDQVSRQAPFALDGGSGTGAVSQGDTVAGTSTAGGGSANHQSGGGTVSAPRQIARTRLSQRNYRPIVW